MTNFRFLQVFFCGEGLENAVDIEVGILWSGSYIAQ